MKKQKNKRIPQRVEKPKSSTAIVEVLPEWIVARNKAMTSGDEDEVRAYFRSIGVEPPADSMLLWAAVHKARTSWTDCPLPLRMLSLQWLMRHDMKALDDSYGA